MKDFLPKEEKQEGKDLSADDLKGTVQSPQFKQVRNEIRNESRKRFVEQAGHDRSWSNA